jgi:hypothetical protein
MNAQRKLPLVQTPIKSNNPKSQVVFLPIHPAAGACSGMAKAQAL